MVSVCEGLRRKLVKFPCLAPTAARGDIVPFFPCLRYSFPTSSLSLRSHTQQSHWETIYPSPHQSSQIECFRAGLDSLGLTIASPCLTLPSAVHSALLSLIVSRGSTDPGDRRVGGQRAIHSTRAGRHACSRLARAARSVANVGTKNLFFSKRYVRKAALISLRTDLNAAYIRHPPRAPHQ